MKVVKIEKIGKKEVVEISLSNPSYISDNGVISHNCDHCKEFWFTEDGITPRVYTMSELMSGGDNIGRKQKDWKAGIGPTHPNERHLLQELRPGFGFKNGRLEWIGKDYRELDEQIKKKNKG